MGGSSHTDTSTKVDPAQMALYQQNYATASDIANQPFQPYTGERVAGFNANQTMGMNALLAAAADPTTSNAISQSMGTVGGLLNYRAPNISAPSVVTPTGAAFNGIGFNGVTPTSVSFNGVSPSSVTAGQLSNTDLAPYLNPYTDDVISASLGDLQRARDQQQVSDNASATAAHAFGGTRQSVLNANTTDDYLRNVAATTCGLHQSAFQNAQQAALSDIGTRLAADQFNTTNKLNADQFNSTGRLNADQFNTTGWLTADQFNATGRLNSDQFNATGAYNAALANAANRLNADQFNATGAYNAGVANAANDITGAGLRLNAANQYAALGDDHMGQMIRQGGLYGTVGAQQQALQQAQDDAAYEEFMRQLNYPNQQQQLRNQALTMMPLQQTQSTTSSKTPGVLDVLDTASKFIPAFKKG